MQRRSILIAAGGSALWPAFSLGQEGRTAYPSRVIRIVVPGAPGTVNDTLARTISAHLSASFGQALVVDNKPGAEGIIAADELARAAPDGYTLSVISSSPLVATPHLRKRLPYTLADFSPIGKLGTYVFVVAAHPSVPGDSLAEVMKFARANPDRISYATGNITSILATRHLLTWGKAAMVQVPYKADTLALNDLIAGRVQLMFGTAGVLSSHIKAGKLRALAVLGSQRSALLADVPTLVEAGAPSFEVTPMAGVFGPEKMAPEIVQRLNTAINAALARADVRQQFDNQGFVTEPSTPDQLASLMRSQYEAWGRAVREAGITPE
jgi:tripartite-type tricarboxylate transporter receptor subunit TctC